MGQQVSGQHKPRIAVVGATGNIGTGLLGRLAADERAASVVGMSRREPSEETPAGARWLPADVGDERCVHQLRTAFEGVDVVVRPAWLFRRPEIPRPPGGPVCWAAVGCAKPPRRPGASAVVHASSVAAYSPGPKRTRRWTRVGPHMAGRAPRTAGRRPTSSGFSTSSRTGTPVRVPWPVARAAAGALWWLRLAPAPPEMAEAAMEFPVMDTARARAELGWRPEHSATEAVAEVLVGLREHAGSSTPPPDERPRGGRLGELATGIGRRP